MQARTIAGGVHVNVGAADVGAVDVGAGPGAWASPQVPAQLGPAPATFADRRGELASLSRHVAGYEQPGCTGIPAVVIVGGPGGVGKTSLCLHWLHRIRRGYPGGQLHADLRGYSGRPPAHPGEVLGQFLRAFGVPPDRVPLDLGERAALYRTVMADRRVIVMLDDAATTAQIRPLLPASAGCLVVVTSRKRLPSMVEYGAYWLRLGPLDEPGALELLAAVAGPGGADRTAAEPGAATTVAARCGRLPLALCAAGAQLATRPHRTIAQLADTLADEQHRLAVLQAGQTGQIGEDEVSDGMPDDRSVQAVFNASYQQLGPEAARLYRLAGLWPGPHLDTDIAAALAGLDTDTAGELLGVLAEASLLEEIAERRYRFHDLVRLHAHDKAQAEPPADRHAAVVGAVEWYLHAAVAADLVVLPKRWRLGRLYRHPPAPAVPLAGPPAALAWLEDHLPNLLAALGYAADHAMNETGWQLCEALWGLFLFRKHYDEWFDSHRIGLECARACADVRAVARMHSQLGSAYRSRGDYERAIDHFTRALHLDRDAGHRRGQASALDQLGVAVLRLGRHDDAIDYFTRSLHLHTELGLPRGVALMHLNIGHALSDAGRHTQAIRHLRIAIRQAAAVPEPYHQARALTILGHTRLRAGQPHRAADPLNQARAILEDLGAPYDLAHTHTHLATLAEHHGDIAAARAHLEQALTLYAHTGARQAADTQARLDAIGPPRPGKDSDEGGDGDGDGDAT